MNIKTANKLYDLRKQSGLSQEELADKIGVSRQAVSKWERAEASPDTDNLILLSRLYNVSLDELLNDSVDTEELKANNSSEEDFDNDEASVHIEDGESTISIGRGEIHISDGNDKVIIGPEKIVLSDENGTIEKETSDSLIMVIVTIAVTIAFFLIGALASGWYWCWLLFLLIPIAGSLESAIKNKKASHFAYPVFIAMVYLLGGLVWPGIWHPTWVMFITIPAYYSICGYFESRRKK